MLTKDTDPCLIPAVFNSFRKRHVVGAIVEATISPGKHGAKASTFPVSNVEFFTEGEEITGIDYLVVQVDGKPKVAFPSHISSVTVEAHAIPVEA